MTDIWRAGLADELAYWDMVMRTRGGDYPDDFRDRLNPELPLQDDLVALLPDRPVVRIHDVGAGPFTFVGKRWTGHEVNITAIDALADEYDRLLATHGISPPVRTTFGHAELTGSDPPVDLAFARNSLDHSYDPMAAIRGMLACAPVVVLSHAIREADTQRWAGLHQHNFWPDDGRFYIEGRAGALCVTDEFAGVADVEVLEQGTWFRVTMRRITPSSQR